MTSLDIKKKILKAFESIGVFGTTYLRTFPMELGVHVIGYN